MKDGDDVVRGVHRCNGCKVCSVTPSLHCPTHQMLFGSVVVVVVGVVVVFVVGVVMVVVVVVVGL